MCPKSGFDILICQLACSSMAIDWNKRMIIGCVNQCVLFRSGNATKKGWGRMAMHNSVQIHLHH